MDSFDEIIPASDRLLEELNLIKGGNKVTCDRGAICRVGSEEQEN